MKINIELYDTEDGRCPVADFIRTLEPKMYAKVLRTIDIAKKYKADYYRRHI